MDGVGGPGRLAFEDVAWVPMALDGGVSAWRSIRGELRSLGRFGLAGFVRVLVRERCEDTTLLRTGSCLARLAGFGKKFCVLVRSRWLGHVSGLRRRFRSRMVLVHR